MDYYYLSELIKRYRAGEATPKEQRLLDDIWSRARADTSFLDSLPAAERALLKAEMFAETQRRIAELQRPVRRWSFSRGVYQAAAAITLLLTASILLYWYAGQMTIVRTGPGERISVVLPDSSHVTLNGNSILRYAAHWNEDGAREVWISGEGFFDVQHTTLHQKFVVHAAHQLQVEVLGTKFNVQSRAQKSEVMLAEGSVKLAVENSTDQPVYLRPGELATVVHKSVSKRSVAEKQYTSWLHNTLVFNRTPLREVAMLLHDTYGLEVTLADSTLARRELSGEISSASAEDILLAISETFDLRVVRDGEAVTITSNPQ